MAESILTVTRLSNVLENEKNYGKYNTPSLHVFRSSGKYVSTQRQAFRFIGK